MKSSFVAILISVIILTQSFDCKSQKGERRYELSTDKSSISWLGFKGEEEFRGKLRVKEGYVVLNEADLNQAVVFADMQSISCADCRDEETSRKILEFANSSGFFNSASMDFAVFKMYKSNKIEEGSESTYQIEGQLTIIGYSQTISIPVTLKEKKDRIYIEGKLTINRALWHLNNPKDSNPENHIEQTIELYLELEGEMKNI